MSVLAGARVVLGVTGSIAAYKAAELASALTQAGAHVDVALSRGAEQFVAPMTFEALTQRHVVTADTPMTPEHRIAHVELGRAADVVVIAPATATTIARLALGLAEDAVTEIALVSAAPVVVAPAMEPGMLAHPATQANVQALHGRGVHIVPPDEGRLASGATGAGPAATYRHPRRCRAARAGAVRPAGGPLDRGLRRGNPRVHGPRALHREPRHGSPRRRAGPRRGRARGGRAARHWRGKRGSRPMALHDPAAWSRPTPCWRPCKPRPRAATPSS